MDIDNLLDILDDFGQAMIVTFIIAGSVLGVICIISFMFSSLLRLWT